MNPKFPYPGTYFIAQSYDQNAFGYPSGHHGGLDIVPLIKPGGNHWPAPIYPVFSGQTLGVSNSDVNRGKGIKVRTKCDPAFISYLKAKSLIPQAYTGDVVIDFTYWHCLEVTDLDGQIDQNTQVGITGNTGNVYAGGIPVDPALKGVPPYPGLHLHLECILNNGLGSVFNLDKDYIGRIDPQIILEYQNMSIEFVHLTGTSEYGFIETTTYTKVYYRGINEADIKFQATKFGLNILNADGTINFTSAKEVNF